MALIRKLAREGAPITLLNHAEERLFERDFDMNDILQAFKIGDIEGPVTAGRNAGEWVCKVTGPVRYPRSTRNMGVITIVVNALELLIETVEWEDKT
jgi:hypothetical protein